MFIEDENYDNIFICHECFKDHDIKQYIIEKGSIENLCNICGKSIKNVNSLDKNLIRMVRALVRYHFPEYLYNSHWGGDLTVAELLSEDNPIICTPSFADAEEKETFSFIMENLIGGLDSQHEIPLYAGHNLAGRDLFAFSKKYEGSRLFNKLVKELISINYNELFNQYEKALSPYITDFKHTIKKGTALYRARIGYEEHKERSEEFDHEIIKKVPYDENDIIAPPPQLSSPGRANREGISYYYLATDINTAIAEVRPHPGHYLTVAQFTIQEDVNVVNLIDLKLYENSFSEEDMNAYVLFKELAMEFEKPLTPDINNRYYISQFISDIFKNLDFDGIYFNSSVSTGKNIVIFNKNKVSKSTDSSELYKILKQAYNIGKVSHNKDYFMDSYDEIVSE